MSNEANRRATKFLERAGVPGGVYHYPCRDCGATCRLLDKAASQCDLLLPPGHYEGYSIGRYISWSQSRIYLKRVQDGRIIFCLDFGDKRYRLLHLRVANRGYRGLRLSTYGRQSTMLIFSPNRNAYCSSERPCLVTNGELGLTTCSRKAGCRVCY